MYEYKTAQFWLQAKQNGAPLDEVDEVINYAVSEGWEFVELSHGVTVGAVSVVVVFCRPKSSADQ